MSVPADRLDETNRRDIVAFYRDVFGWQELPTETLDRRQLVLSAYRVDQFIFLIADDEPMRSPKMDHFGLGVATMDELDTFYQRALDYRKRDDRVNVIDKQTEQHPGITLTSFYVGYLLPLMVEVQHFAFG
jgi:predicted enzyme related to lactoylglutathione lyase